MSSASLAALVEGARSSGYIAAGRATLESLQSSGPVSPLTAGLWLMTRLKDGLAVSSIVHSVAAARAASIRTPGMAAWGDVLNDIIVTDALDAMRRLDGPPPLTKGAVPMTIEVYIGLRDSAGPLHCRQLLAIAWLRAARTKDVQVMKAEGLWMPAPTTLALELGQEKARRLGIPGYITVHCPEQEKQLLLSLMTDATGTIRTTPPTTPPSTRLPLLATTYAQFLAFVRAHRPEGSRVTPHSLRKGAVHRMIAAGIPLRDVALVTQHRSVPGLLAYVSNLDWATERSLTRASRAISAAAPTATSSRPGAASSR